MSRLSYQKQCIELESETARFAAALCGPDISAPVPTCPDWTLVQLAAHVHRGVCWAATMVERRTATPVRPTEVEADLPASPRDRATALRDGAARLVAAVRDYGPDAPTWSWADEPTAGFWLGRMLHETLVHRVDAEFALGRDLADVEVPPGLAADCVADMLMITRNLSASSRHAFAGLRGTGQALLFQATDEELGENGAWLARRAPSGVEWTWGTGPADVTVRGTARDLMLVLTRRMPAGHQLEVEGDSGLLTHWLDNSKLTALGGSGAA
jgi:uncharacterized protein (TIGR03083 family)